MRCCSASKSSRGDWSEGRRTSTTSPSITQRAGSCARTWATTSGKYRVIVLPPRLTSSTSSPSRKMIVRKPSHFGSYRMPSAVGIFGTALASIGSTGGITGNCIPQPSPQAAVDHEVSGPRSPDHDDSLMIAAILGVQPHDRGELHNN
jgi:hypothetical protein